MIWKRVVPYNDFIDIEEELAELVKNRPKLDEIPSTEKRLQELENKIVERIEKSLRDVVREILKRELIFDELAKRLKALGLDKISKEVGEEKRIDISPSIRKTIEELIEIVGEDELPDDPETAVMMSDWYIFKNEYDKALKLCDWALKLDPNNANVWLCKGFVLAEMKKYEDALKCFDVSLIFEPNDEVAWNNKGVCLTELGKLNEALECLNRALELDPNFAGAWTNKGTCLLELNKYDEALECFNRALELDPNYALAWNNKGTCLTKLNKYDEAEKCYLKALELNPKEIIILQNLSRLYQITGKFDEALKLAKKAVRMSKDINNRAISRYLVITALFLKGEQRKAKNEIKKLIKEIKDAGDEFKPDKITWDFKPLLPTIDEKLSENDRKIVYALIKLLKGEKSLYEFEKLTK